MSQRDDNSQIVSRLAFDELVAKNVEAINRIERAAQERRTNGERISDAIAHFCGTRAFILVHCAWFGFWLIWNGTHIAPRAWRWDPRPFSTLTLVVALEAIFLTTFILSSQNRQQRTADQRNHLDLQINMLAEQETSQMLIMMRQMMEHFEIPIDYGGSKHFEQATDAEKMAEQIDEILDTSSVSGSS